MGSSKGQEKPESSEPKWIELFNAEAFRFAFISAGVFIALTAFFYLMYNPLDRYLDLLLSLRGHSI